MGNQDDNQWSWNLQGIEKLINKLIEQFVQDEKKEEKMGDENHVVELDNSVTCLVDLFERKWTCHWTGCFLISQLSSIFLSFILSLSLSFLSLFYFAWQSPRTIAPTFSTVLFSLLLLIALTNKHSNQLIVLLLLPLEVGLLFTQHNHEVVLLFVESITKSKNKIKYFY